VYEYATTESPGHKELRNLVIAAISNRPVVQNSTLRLESTIGLLRSTADLATDLLLSGLNTTMLIEATKHLFVCAKCPYVHVGARNCQYVTFGDGASGGRRCPKCQNHTRTTSKRAALAVDLVRAYPCPLCEGTHTLVPEYELPTLSADEDY
jgi:hypothetical protein